MEAAQRARIASGEREAGVRDRQVAYMSIRRNPKTELYRIVGFEDSTDPSLQNLYGDFTEGQANAILVRVGMSPSQARETLAAVMELVRTYRFHLELSSQQGAYLRFTLGGCSHVGVGDDLRY
jgi:hypothetical protein